MSIVNHYNKRSFRILIVSLLMSAFVFSSVNILFFSQNLERWILVFYNPDKQNYEREVRFLKPIKDSAEESLKVMVREILLGSFNPLYLPFWSRETPLLSLFFEDDILYLNVGYSVLRNGEESLRYLKEDIQRNIAQNFSFKIKGIVLAVEGETWYP